MDHISPWRFRLVDQQPASGLLDRGILVPSSAILPLAMLEPKYSMVPRLLCSLRALRESPNRSLSSNDPAQLRIVMVLDQNSPTACMERRPVVFTMPLERRPKNTWRLLRQIQPRTALNKPHAVSRRYLERYHKRYSFIYLKFDAPFQPFRYRCHRRHADRLREPDPTSLWYLQIGPEVEKIH